MKFKEEDRIKVVKGKLKGLVDVVHSVDKGRARLSSQAREYTKVSLRRGKGKLSLRSINVANLRHVDTYGSTTKVTRERWSNGRYRFYASSGTMVRGDASAIIRSKRRNILKLKND